MSRKILYVDMDGVLVDFDAAVAALDDATRRDYAGRYDETPGIFGKMPPMAGALTAFATLAERFDAYILSTATWDNPSAWSDKLIWVKRYLPEVAHKRLILSHNKHLCAGDYLIDDRTKQGADRFTGEHIHFGTERFPDWDHVLAYLAPRA